MIVTLRSNEYSAAVLSSVQRNGGISVLKEARRTMEKIRLTSIRVRRQPIVEL